jgi:hypothetical protein
MSITVSFMGSHAIDDKAIDFLEEQIPMLAEGAFRKAYVAALAAGQSVLEVIGDELCETFPDGSRRVVKKVARDVSYPAGTKLRLP